MNARAEEALYEAERQGVRQIFGRASDPNGGQCAGAVLADVDEYLPLRTIFGKSCPACERWAGLWCEADLVFHLNDDHRFTFSEIARKLGPDSV